MSNNIVKAGFYGGRFATTRSLYQYDYGIKLKIEGLELPTVFETHFSNGEFDETTTAIGNNGVVVIPDIYLTTGKMVYAFIYLHTESDDGETVYRINIPVKKRGKPIDQEATPQEQSTITQAIAELNNAINVSNSNAEYAEGYMNQAHGYSTDAYNHANTASEQAILAGHSAETAEQMKNDAIGAATRASASATRAEDNAVIAVNNANAAAQSVEDAESSAESAVASATDAAASAQSAHSSAQSIQSMTVEATTLTPGSPATATWNGNSGTLSLGIPAGIKGDPGEGITYHVCSSGEYDATTGEPTIQSPQENIIYLVPSQDGDNPNLFTEWIYVNSAWEMFGSPKINLDDYITDVTINGTSIVNNGVAEIPIGHASSPGVFKLGSGLYVAADNSLRTLIATDSLVKKGTDDYRPIMSSNAYKATFYGLAKAAGDTTQSQSNNAVGTYTDDAKSAIQTMLGVASTSELDEYAKKSTFDDAGITNKTYTTICDTTITTVTDENHDVPYYGLSNATISSRYKYRITFDNIIAEYGCYDFLTYYSNTRKTKGVEYIGNLELYNSDEYQGAVHPIDDVDFCIVLQGNEFDGLQIFTQTAGEHQIKIERINYTSSKLPNTLIYGDEDSPIVKKLSTTSSYYGISIGQCNSLENPRGSFAIGSGNIIKAQSGIAIGISNVVSGDFGIAIGQSTVASGQTSYAEGELTTASGEDSHAEGWNTTASGDEAHSEGLATVASGTNSHAEGGSTVASGRQSHAAGLQTIANHRAQTVFGRYNIADPSDADSTTYGNYVEIVGNGTSSGGRSNARTLDWSGNEVLSGKLTVGVTPTESMDVATKGYVDTAIANSSIDVQVNGTSVVNNGVANIPLIGHNQLGVGLVDSSYGLQAAGNGRIQIFTALDSAIKAGTDQYRPITPSNQHTSSFYGLAKAAGDSTQSASSNAVGTYTDDAKASIQTMLGVPSADEVVTEVQINGTSVVSNGVANIPIAGSNTVGCVSVSGDGLAIVGSTRLRVQPATSARIKEGTILYQPIDVYRQHEATFYGLAKAAGADEANSTLPMGTYTDTAKVAIRNMIGATGESATITVTGTDPVITAQSNARYICGEVLSLTFTPPATGICEVIFTSGSSVTVLDLPQTVMMPDWFEVETNKTYDISIVDGIYGAVMSW